jgi:hypothetical protein
MSESAKITYIRSLAAVRSSCSLLLANPTALSHFSVDLTKLDPVVDTILSLIKRDYPAGPSDIPMHSRWRHFCTAPISSPSDTSGKKRIDVLIEEWKQSGTDMKEIVKRLLDLFVVSVLLDAGAGPGWKFTTKEGGLYNRSEGLAMASLELFLGGGIYDLD